jgi:hypothetical protein
MTESELSTLRESLSDVASALTGLLASLHRRAPEEDQEFLRDLFHLSADAVDRLRGYALTRALEEPATENLSRCGPGLRLRAAFVRICASHALGDHFIGQIRVVHSR